MYLVTTTKSITSLLNTGRQFWSMHQMSLKGHVLLTQYSTFRNLIPRFPEFLVPSHNGTYGHF